MDIQQLIETWQINNRINLYLLDAIAPEHLVDGLSSKGRNVGEQFAHVHNVRLMWLKAALPEELAGKAKVEKENAGDKELLKLSLEQSGTAIVKLLEFAAANGGRVKGFKPHFAAFVGYLTAHDAHHRSQVIIALKQSGHPLDKKILYGIWEWGARNATP
ncbi:MAG: DinB family protein [Pyrinomonadaceae bacterium]